MEAEHSPQPGQLLGGKYRIVRAIGRGAMGVVLEAQHVQTGKRVAVKWLHAHVMESRSAVERLMREAQASARVRHSNVVDVYDVEREGDALFLVMEYLEGEPLTNWLERGGVPIHELLNVIVQAMRGVSEAHRRGIVHRDIKPDNIFLAYEPDQRLPIAKVLDFGISKIDAPGGLSLTQTGSALGTPLYMSYEQLSGVRDVDARSDVYGFGVILYEALTGTLPYAADNFAELAAKVITSEPLRPRQLRPEIPEALEQVVLWAMMKRREERAPNLSVLIEALTPFTVADQGRVSLSSARLPSLPAIARLPVSSEPAPPPSTPNLRLDEQTGWNDILTRSERERREAEQRVTSLVAGTMYEGRRKRRGSGGVWMAIVGALGAVAVGVVLATVSRGGDSKSRDDQAAQAPVTTPEPPAPEKEAEQAPPPAEEPAPAAAAPAPAEPPPELLQPAAPTQVEQVQKFDAVQPDAGVARAAPAAPAGPHATGPLPKNSPGGAARAGGKSGPRPAYSPPSGESLPPPPIIEAAPVQELAPAVDSFPPVTSPTPPPAPTPAPEGPVDPVDVNPFEGDPEPGEAYRAGKPREDEF